MPSSTSTTLSLLNAQASISLIPAVMTSQGFFNTTHLQNGLTEKWLRIVPPFLREFHIHIARMPGDHITPAQFRHQTPSLSPLTLTMTKVRTSPVPRPRPGRTEVADRTRAPKGPPSGLRHAVWAQIRKAARNNRRQYQNITNGCSTPHNVPPLRLCDAP